MHTQGSSTFVPVNKVFFNYNSNFQHKKTEAGCGLTPVKWTAVKKDYAAIEIRYSIGAR